MTTRYGTELPEAELGRDFLPRKEVRLVASLQPLDVGPPLGELLRGGPGRFRYFCCFAHIGSLARRNRRIRLSPGTAPAAGSAGRGRGPVPSGRSPTGVHTLTRPVE